MRLSISNLAWDTKEDNEVANILQHNQIDAIDIAPTKYFPQPSEASSNEIFKIKDWWAQRGIELIGMQSLLFGTTGLNVFGSNEIQNKMLQHLTAICRIGSELGATRLTFGSPKNKDRSHLDDHQALEIALAFFQKLGDTAKQNGVIICLEPTPPSFGANFMTNSAETISIIQQLNHPAIRLQIDTAAMTMNNENLLDILPEHANLVGHIHASEPDLLTLGEGKTNHPQMAKHIKQYLSNKLITIEMLINKSEENVPRISRAIQFAQQQYA